VSVRNIYYNLCISDGVIEECGFGGAGTAVLENGKKVNYGYKAEYESG
jgi:hypothetical protein